LYNWPNAILSLFGGYLVDRYFGINWGAIIFCCFTFSGQFILGLGAFTDQFWLMCLGRVIFAIGGENLVVTSNMRAVKWFKGRELSMVFGMQLSVNRAGSTINFNVMTPLYNYFNKSYVGYKCLGIVFMIVSIMTGIDLLIACMLAIRDRRAERILKMKEKSSADKIRIKDLLDFKLDFWSIVLIIIFYYVAIFPFVSLGM
jgi:MFS family permease